MRFKNRVVIVTGGASGIGLATLKRLHTVTVRVKSSSRSEEKIYQTLADKAPLKRLGTPDEVANVAIFLLSGGASYITGALVLVDGGVAAGAS